MEKITEKYYLGSNKNTYILYEKKISVSTGKETYKNVGYLRTLEAVYTTLLEKEIKENLTLLNNMNEITKMIKELREFTEKYVNEHCGNKNEN